MGRPLNKKYFGNTNLGSASTSADNFIGGEGLSAIVVTNTATNAGYSTTTNVTWVASAPQLPTGVAASGTAVVWFNGGQGRIQSLAVTEPGSGYTSTSSVTLTYTPARVGGTAATVHLTLASTQQNAIQPTAFIGTGSSAVVGDIIKQESTRKYLVKTAQGIGQCKLSTTTLTAGNMWILATDVNGSSYYVTKLTAHKAYLTRKAMVGSYEYATGAVAKWNLSAASAGNVKITNG